MSGAKDGNGERDVVAVVGCGMMGSAIARCLARGTHRVLAWNRTHERAESLAGAGVTPVRDLVAAIREASLVVSCTTSLETTLAALEPVAEWGGTTLVDLTSGVPEEAEELERWATGRGAAFLDGAVIAYPWQIGLPETMVAYSGSSAVWSAYKSTLMELGGTSAHLSEDVGTASLINIGVVGFYIAALGAYVEAATYIQDRGLAMSEMDEMTERVLDMLGHATKEARSKIESGDHETDQATIRAFADGMRFICADMENAGQRSRIVSATKENLEAAEAAGLGELDFYAQSRVLRTDS